MSGVQENPTTPLAPRSRLADKADPPEDQAIYRDVFLSRLRQVAREHGYAIAVHGSEQRDLDLVAVPWAVEAVSAQAFVDALCEAMTLIPNPESPSTNPEPKPWGRLAWSLLGTPKKWWRYVDLSVAPRAGEAVPVAVWRDR